VQRPSDDALRKARTNLRSLVSDGPSQLPSLNLVADSVRLELEKRGKVALLYISLDRYGRLEPIFGWRIVAEILDAVAANLESMAGSTLRRLDVVSDFTLTDDAFIVLLSPPRSAQVIADDDLAAVTRRDPTIVPRVWPVAEAFTAILLLDHYMQHIAFQTLAKK
jgi:hypothetical protein